MEHLLELIKKRRQPGILILDRKGRIRYSNREILAMLPNLLETDARDKTRTHIPEEIMRICTLALRMPVSEEAAPVQNVETDCSIMVDGTEQFFSLRAFGVSGFNRKKGESYVMVLVERVVEKHDIDFEKIKKNYHISGRELDVIRMLCQGLSNRAIGEKLYISEYTVKDHLKNIMAKMGVESRNEILALLH